MLRKPLSCLLLGAVAFHSIPAVSQEVWVGRPTVGDYFRRDAQEVLKAFVDVQRAGQQKVYLTQDIINARKAFFATANSPQTREGVGKEFAKLLSQKDLYYFQMYVTYGTDPAGIERVRVLDSISKGAVDGGILPEVFQDYLDWVNGFRSSLGFSGNSALGGFSSKALLSQDQAALAKAFKDNMPLYAKYQEARDTAEIERFTKQKKLNQDIRASRQKIAGAKGADGSHKLDSESTVPLQMANHIRGALLVKMPQQWNAAVRSVAKEKTLVLECHYGPVSLSESGQPLFETHKFWHATVPATLTGFFPLNNGALGFAKYDNLDKSIALDSCPSTEAQALTIALGAPASPAGTATPANTAAPAVVDTGAAAQGTPLEPRGSGSPGAYPPAARGNAPSVRDRMAAAAAEQDARRAANNKRACAGREAQLARVRAQLQAVPPQHSAQLRARLETMERSHSQACGS